MEQDKVLHSAEAKAGWSLFLLHLMSKVETVASFTQTVASA
jgi:hypothetical protein